MSGNLGWSGDGVGNLNQELGIPQLFLACLSYIYLLLFQGCAGEVCILAFLERADYFSWPVDIGLVLSAFDHKWGLEQGIFLLYGSHSFLLSVFQFFHLTKSCLWKKKKKREKGRGSIVQWLFWKHRVISWSLWSLTCIEHKLSISAVILGPASTAVMCVSTTKRDLTLGGGGQH